MRDDFGVLLQQRLQHGAGPRGHAFLAARLVPLADARAAYCVGDALVRRPYWGSGDQAPGRRAAPAADHDLTGHRLLADDAALLRWRSWSSGRSSPSPVLTSSMASMVCVSPATQVTISSSGLPSAASRKPSRSHLHACFVQQSRGLLRDRSRRRPSPIACVDLLALARLRTRGFRG